MAIYAMVTGQLGLFNGLLLTLAHIQQEAERHAHRVVGLHKGACSV